MKAEAPKTLNGLNLTQMFETLSAIKSDPKLAQFQFRTKNEWVNGAMNRSTIQGFYGAGREDDSRKEPFVFVNGEPPVLLGTNQGANPVEFLLHGLIGCVTTTLVLHAAARGIHIQEISTDVEGEIDLQGLLDLKDITPGYEQIRLKMNIKADCSDSELEELMAFAHSHSPVCQTVCRPVPVILERAAVTAEVAA
ncbi:MAG TPA: OsmC family protein [bacterium]|nr:OsmC family protein [bacterium]